MVQAKMKNQHNQRVASEQIGGVCLVVVDGSPEFEAALRSAAVFAKQNDGHVALLCVIEDEGFLHWNFVEREIQKDKRAEAEKALWDAAQRLYDLSGTVSSFYIKEGKTYREVARILNTDRTIRKLVLGASSVSSNPLISYFTGKGLNDLRVPLLIVPEDVETDLT